MTAELQPFAAETDMLLPISRSTHALAGRRRARRGPSVFYEFGVAEGLADVVLLEFDEAAIERRYMGGLEPVLGHLAIRTLWRLDQGAASTTHIAASLGASVDHLRRRTLPELALAGWLRRDEDGDWVMQAALEPLARWIIAIEAKRRDWRSALHQAQRYRRFANRSVAILDATTGLSAAIDTIAARPDIGLARLASSGGRVESIHLPPWLAPRSPAEFILAGELAWSMRREGRVSGPIEPVYGRVLDPTRGADPRAQGELDGFPRPALRLSR